MELAFHGERNAVACWVNVKEEVVEAEATGQSNLQGAEVGEACHLVLGVVYREERE